MDISVPLTNAYVVQGTNHGSPPTYSGYTGNGVILGIVDTGLDLTHNDFRNSDGTTRVLYMWDQQVNSGVHPSPYTYGSEYTASQINANLNISQDTIGRGTHLAGICASNGQQTGGTCSTAKQYRYIGMAPKADLIIVKTVGTDQSLIDGTAYIFAKATTLGKPAVVLVIPADASNIPHWIQRGPHDGSSVLDQGISNLTGPNNPGKIVVCPVGANGKDAIHSFLDLPTGGSGSLTWSVPSYTHSTGEKLDMEAWHDPTASFQVRLTLPSGTQSAWIQPGTATGNIDTSNDGSYFINNDVDSTTKAGVTIAKMIQVYAFLRISPNYPSVGTYMLEVQRLGPATTGRLDAWIADWKFGSGGVSPVFTSNIDSSMQVCSPATGDYVISASAFTTKNAWTNFICQTSIYSDSPPIGDIYEVSNKGPRRDGVQCPDVSAPGEGIMSALSVAVQASGNFKGEDSFHWILRGTEQAAAHVAGAMALRLEQIPGMNSNDAKAFLHELAMADQYTGQTPNNVWGSGKLWINTTNPAVGYKRLFRHVIGGLNID